MENDKRLAVLIDGDNIPSAHVKEMMEEIAKYGNPTIKRIYGDWTRPGLTKWKNLLLDNAINPVQQYGYTKGKNSTDSAMIIDAMDILYAEKVDGFCIVSSDSDFTRLAMRLREAGMLVIGIGEKKTPEPFIVACDRFIYVEILKRKGVPEQQPPQSKRRPARNEKGRPVDQVQEPLQEVAQESYSAPTVRDEDTIEMITPRLIQLISATISDLADEDGWAFLGDVGSLLQKKQPDFDSRNYGFQKLTPLINSIPQFEIEQRDNSKARYKLIYVRNR